MRIIAGQAKGRKIKSLEGRKVRPTSDRVKEAVFSMLGFAVSGGRVLDLFAGTGNLGLEALSRGASMVTFIDNNTDACNVIKHNVKLLGFEEQAEVYLTDAFKAVKKFGSMDKKYDIIFIDPPYGDNIYNKIVSDLVREDIIDENGMVILEHSSHYHPEENFKGMAMLKRKKYGNTSVTIYIKEDAR